MRISPCLLARTYTRNEEFNMRELNELELSHVSGAGSCQSPAPPRVKGNNGFGNGGGDPAPGASGSTGADKLADVVR